MSTSLTPDTANKAIALVADAARKGILIPRASVAQAIGVSPNTFHGWLHNTKDDRAKQFSLDYSMAEGRAKLKIAESIQTESPKLQLDYLSRAHPAEYSERYQVAELQAKTPQLHEHKHLSLSIKTSASLSNINQLLVSKFGASLPKPAEGETVEVPLTISDVEYSVDGDQPA